MSHKILIVDDEDNFVKTISQALQRENYTVFTASNGKEGLAMLRQNEPDVVLTDYKMPEMNGLEFIKAAKAMYARVPVIIMTGKGDKKTSVEFLKEGAFRYIEKPFSADEIKITVQEAIDHVNLLCENKNLHNLLSVYTSGITVIGDSKAMQAVFALIDHVAKTDATVLILGESGTGKGLIAKEIHERSSRRGNPFLTFNCAAFPETLVESELFGYEKGAFTGADKVKPGRFELANHGTIFLDEIGELSMAVQSKLLRIIEDKEYEYVGGTQTIKADVRIISATNQNLTSMVAQKKFREDLFYRLNVFPIKVPPLRDRDTDVILLAEFFLEKYACKYNKPIKGFSQKALDIIKNYKWRGNVRELENVISRAVIVCNDTFLSESLLPFTPEEDNTLADAVNGNYTEDELVRAYAKKIYEKNGRNKKKTCEALNINFRTLNNRLQ